MGKSGQDDMSCIMIDELWPQGQINDFNTVLCPGCTPTVQDVVWQAIFLT